MKQRNLGRRLLTWFIPFLATIAITWLYVLGCWLVLGLPHESFIRVPVPGQMEIDLEEEDYVVFAERFTGQGSVFLSSNVIRDNLVVRLVRVEDSAPITLRPHTPSDWQRSYDSPERYGFEMYEFTATRSGFYYIRATFGATPPPTQLNLTIGRASEFRLRIFIEVGVFLVVLVLSHWYMRRRVKSGRWPGPLK